MIISRDKEYLRQGCPPRPFAFGMSLTISVCVYNVLTCPYVTVNDLGVAPIGTEILVDTSMPETWLLPMIGCNVSAWLMGEMCSSSLIPRIVCLHGALGPTGNRPEREAREGMWAFLHLRDPVLEGQRSPGAKVQQYTRHAGKKHIDHLRQLH
ncbi:hypothetical protein DPEC_G00161410 [Dallia pectoralis]|uniref:Uncharacterized protein n=1 Tax=Dallia pectoralis TaxID=75939 RepID=A0ACC2GGH5_DALPE|nr:hypothetical protein DPEC_G00161410 [Dallia pectoralis]